MYMFSSNEVRRSWCRVLAAGLFAASTLSGCVAFVPYLQPDAQARGDGPKKVCPISGFTPGIPGPDGDAPVSHSQPPAQDQRRSRTEASVQRLISQLADKEPAVRTGAATDLGSFGAAAESAVEPLAKAVRQDPSEWVRRAAVKSLAKIGTPGVVEPLRLALNDRNKWVAHSATNALRKLGYRDSSVLASRSRLARPNEPASLPPIESVAPVSSPVFEVRGDSVKKL